MKESYYSKISLRGKIVRQMIQAVKPSLLMSIVLLTFVNLGFSQKKYTITAGAIYELNEGILPRLVVTCSPEPLWATDIAISPDGKFYAVLGWELVEIDTITGESIILHTYSELQGYPSLVCNNDFELYSLNLNGNFFKYNLISGVEEFVAESAYYTPGDITFFNGNLVYPTNRNEGLTNKIVAHNLNTGITSTLFCLPEAYILQDSEDPNPAHLGKEVWGITNVFTACGEEKLFISNNFSEYFEVDLESNTLIEIPLDLDMLLTDSTFRGLASSNEHLASACDYSFEDLDCATLSIDEKEMTDQLLFYPNPVKDVINIANSETILALKIVDINGRVIKLIHNPAPSESLSDLASGHYFLHIETANSSSVVQLIKR